MLCLGHEEKYLAKIEELVKETIPRMDPPEAMNAKSKRDDKKDDAPKEKSERKRGKDSGKTKPDTTETPSETPETKAKAEPSNNKKSGGGKKDRQGAVKGLGDHVPAFLMREFRPEKPATKPNKQSKSEEPDKDASEETDAS